MPHPEVKTALEGAPQKSQLVSQPPPVTETSSDGLRDPLVDPMTQSGSMAPPVEQPIGADAVVQVLQVLGVHMSTGDANLQPLFRSAFGSINALTPDFIELDVLSKAGAIDPLKAVNQRIHLLTQLSATLGTVPDTDPRIAAFKDRVRRELAKSHEQHLRLIQQQADAEQKKRMAADRKALGGIRETLMSATIE